MHAWAAAVAAALDRCEVADWRVVGEAGGLEADMLRSICDPGGSRNVEWVGAAACMVVVGGSADGWWWCGGGGVACVLR